ncbi:19598_t:CDS:1, partial [Dentiscutata erythropus]
MPMPINDTASNETSTMRQCIQATIYDNDTYDTYEYDIYKQQLLRWATTSERKI